MILLVTVHLPGTSSEVHRGKIMCMHGNILHVHLFTFSVIHKNLFI